MLDIALLIDGKEQSLLTADFAMNLAKLTNKEVDAYMCINNREILKLTGIDAPGLCGSGEFIRAYERIADVMNDLAETLMEALGRQSERECVDLRSNIVLGDPVKILSEYMNAQTLLVLSDSQEHAHIASKLLESRVCSVAMVGRQPAGCKTQVMIFHDLNGDLDEVLAMVRRLPWEVETCISSISAQEANYRQECPNAA